MIAQSGDSINSCPSGGRGDNALPWRATGHQPFGLAQGQRRTPLLTVLMTKAHCLRSRVIGNHVLNESEGSHVRFGSGGGVGDRPADHNYAAEPSSSLIL